MEAASQSLLVSYAEVPEAAGEKDEDSVSSPRSVEATSSDALPASLAAQPAAGASLELQPHLAGGSRDEVQRSPASPTGTSRPVSSESQSKKVHGSANSQTGCATADMLQSCAKASQRADRNVEVLAAG